MEVEKYISRCLQLAQNGKGRVEPNPLVGAIVVYDSKIISEGYHEQFGSAHAEVNAINRITDSEILKKSALYVNLEPCSHHGKTPPCAELIIKKGIKNVVISNIDPNPLVAGNGINLLKKHNINVTTGVLEKEGAFLNRRFFTFHKHKRPYVILKWAQTSDHYFAPLTNNKANEITWISNETSRLLTHKWRGREQAILVGNNTVIKDNPQLTTRHFSGRNPIRVIIDPFLKLNRNYKVFNQQAPTYIACYTTANKKDYEHIITCKPDELFIPDLLHKLYDLNIQSIIIEGGAYTLKKFIESDLWDEARIFSSDIKFGAGLQAPEINGISVSKNEIGNDSLEILKNQKNQFL